MASLAMGVACALVGLGGLFNDELSSSDDDDDGNENDGNDVTNATRAQFGLVLELLGVSFMSFQCSLGEASLLALAGKFDGSLLPKLSSSSVSSSSMDSYSALDNDNNIRFDSHDDIDEGLFAYEEEEQHNNNAHTNNNEQSSSSATLMKTEKQHRKCITAFASGTGLAGIVGYAYKSLLAELFGWGLSYIVWSAILFAMVYYRTYCTGLYEMDIRLEEAASRNRLEGERCASSLTETDGVEELNDRKEQRSSLEMVMQPHDGEEENGSSTLLSQYSSASTTTATKSVHHMTAWERFQTVFSLWPYMIPLFFVYMTEYMMVSHFHCKVAFCRICKYLVYL